MSSAYNLPNGNMMVPMRAESEGVLGDGMVEVGPDDPNFKAWEKWHKQQGTEMPVKSRQPASAKKDD